MKAENKNYFFIQKETEQDIPGIRAVNNAAFGGSGEAEVIDNLRQNCPVFISLVAKIGDSVVGHILFTPTKLVQQRGSSIEGIGLAPLAVLPDFQNRGIGSALCKAGLNSIKSAGFPYAVVLGDPIYYSRFGFLPASSFGIKSSYVDVPDEAFMIKIFDAEVMKGIHGIVYYQKEFDSVT